MKKWISLLLALTMLLSFTPLSAFARETIIYLPTRLEKVEEEAFAGNTAIERVFIPENVSSIGKRAFAGCSGLQEVIINRSGEIEIAKDAFEGVEMDNVHFIVLPDTSAELACLSHGFLCDRAEIGTQYYDRIQQLVAEHGGTSELQSGADTMRLIVRRASNRLPDISMYNPVDIVRKDDVFIIQFDDPWDVADCMTFLRAEQKENGNPDDYQQYDQTVSANFFTDVEAAGVIDPDGWGTDDPMGFDVYAPFVAQEGSGTVKIAVIDSGVRNVGNYTGRLDTDNARNMTDDGGEWYNDSAAHGSFVTAVIDECVGENNVSILPIRVVNNYTLAGTSNNKNGNIDYALVGDAIDYAVECGADIINLSMAFSSCTHVEHCIDKALAAGVTVVVAAGNTGRTIDSHVFPANLPQVITVAGIDSNYTLIGNYGPTIDYCAPYEWYQTAIGDSSGTSFSAPTIAAALALVSMDPYHTVEDLNHACYHDNGSGTGGNSYGYGMPHLEELAEVPGKNLVFDTDLPSELKVGQELDLKYGFYPANTTDQTVTVSSGDESILTLLNDGKTVKALRQGTAILTVKSNRWPNLVASKTFRVVQPVEKITITGARERLPLGRTMQLNAVIAPTDATTQTIEWISTNENLVTVSEDGLVRITEGVTENDLFGEPVVGVLARATDGYDAQSDTVSFKVVAIPDAEDIKLYIGGKEFTNANVVMKPDQTHLLTANVLPSDADQVVRLYSSDETIVSISQISDLTANLTANRSGSAVITVTSVDRKASAELRVTVLPRPSSVSISGESIIYQGATTTLTATVLPDNAYDQTVSWSSSNSSVATVNSKGVVTGIKAGTAVITATANGDPNVKSTLTITVQPPYVTEIAIATNPTTTNYIAGDAFSAAGLTIRATYNDGTEETHSAPDCTISSPNMTTAGTKQVTVSYGGKSTTFDITVNALTISLSANTSTGPNGYIQLSASAPRGTVSWTSNNSNVATVDSGGKVTFKTTVGTAVITATVNNNGVTQSASKTVTISNSQGTKFGETSSSSTATILYGTQPGGYSTALPVTGSIPSYTTNSADVSNSSTNTSTGRVDVTFTNNGVDGYVYYQFNYNSSSGRDNTNKVINYQEGWRQTLGAGNDYNYYYYTSFGRQFYSSTNYSEHRAEQYWDQYYAIWWAYRDKQEGHTWYIATGIDGALAASWYRFPLTKYTRTTTTYTYYRFTIS